MKKNEFYTILGIQIAILVFILIGLSIGFRAVKGRDTDKIQTLQDDMNKVKARLRIDQPTPAPKVKVEPPAPQQ